MGIQENDLSMEDCQEILNHWIGAEYGTITEVWQIIAATTLEVRHI